MSTTLHRPKSFELYQKALQVIPGGVNSPIRAFRSMEMPPLIIEEGLGDKIVDIDGHSYIDYCGSWGPLILGHAHPTIVKAAQNRMAKGSTFGIATAVEERLASKIVQLIPSIDKIRFVSSGTEATMSAIRLARAFTGREKIIKFEGHYHGHADHLLVKAGSGVIEIPEATSQGVPLDVIKNTISLPFNDFEIMQSFLERNRDIAAIILEPIAANMGVVPPSPQFLEMLRKQCTEKNIVLIFDEVITGFRVGLHGAQGLYNIKPDLTCFGKIIGGGFPAAAFGGRKEIMDLLAPLGPVYQAGTLSGNPVAMEAGLATLELIEEPNFYHELESKTAEFLNPISEFIEKNNLNCALQRVGSMFTLFFGTQKVTQFQKMDQKGFRSFFHALFNQGIYFSPLQYEANFLSSAHTAKSLLYTQEIILEYLSKNKHNL